MRRGQEHRVVDLLAGAHIKRTAKDSGKSEDVVDLVIEVPTPVAVTAAPAAEPDGHHSGIGFANANTIGFGAIRRTMPAR